MSDYIKKLAEQAGMEWETQSWCWLANPPHLERFAELVRDDERERVYNILISGDCDGSVKTYIRKILEQGAEN